MGTYITAIGQPITTEAVLGKGGEGDIYRVPSNLQQVAKIYHEKDWNGERENKLKAMILNPPVDETRQKYQHISIAWPEEILYEKGEVVGFLMPNIDKHPIIYECFAPQSRTKFPGINGAHLHHIAANLAAAVHSIHMIGHVIGDINQKNILVTPQSMITVIDTDSFQVRDQNGKIYRCLVGSPEFMAPELLEKNEKGDRKVRVENTDRTPHQDNFGLAVLIYKLIADGRHPFYTADSYVEDQLNVVGNFNNLPLKTIHPGLQRLFAQCFLDGASAGQIAEHQHRSDDGALVIDDRRPAIVDRDFTAVAGNQECMVAKPDDGP